MSQNYDVAIIGGGIIGCNTAYNLAKAGLRVLVLEKQYLGAEASSAAAGLIVPTHVVKEERNRLFDLYMESTRLFTTLIPDLEAQTGMQLEYIAEGCLTAALSEAEAQTMAETCKNLQNSLDTELVWLDQQEIHELEPDLGDQVYGGIFATEEGSVNNARMVLALARAASEAGAIFEEGCLVTGFELENDRFVAVESNQGRFEAAHLIITSGAWSQTLCRPLGIEVPISPARGQIFAARVLENRLRHPVESSFGGVSPKADGSIHVGGIVEHVGFDKQISTKNTLQLMEIAKTLIPALASAKIERIWTGLRPYCADGKPILGPLPHLPNVALATGHFKMGITGSPITAQLLENWVTQQVWPADLAAFLPNRFLV